MMRPSEGMHWEDVEDITRMVNEKFKVEERFFYSGLLSFRISPESDDIKGSFKKLVDFIKEKGYIPFLRVEHGDLILRITAKPTVKESKKTTFYILLIATLVVVFVDGYIRSTDSLMRLLTPNLSPVVQAGLFTLFMFGIIAIHELGHKVMLHIEEVESSPPYFIPGIPLGTIQTLPTFGAVIFQKEVPTNRDKMFDLGFSGPLFGLLATIFVTTYVVLNSYSPSQIEMLIGDPLMSVPTPPLFIMVQSLVGAIFPATRNRVILLNDPIAFVAYVGMIITFLNAMPAWQLDGGHMSMAVLGPRMHTVATILSMVFMVLIGYFMMALFLLFLWTLTGGRYPKPLDDYSKISGKRKLLFILMLFVALICAPIVP